MGNDVIYAYTPYYVVKKILKKTTSQGFKDLKVGDVFRLKVPIKRWGCSCHGTYATYIDLCVGDKFYEAISSMNLVSQRLKCFEFEEWRSETHESV
nr:MAG TPA: hypothetical protein [Caudoviricetes sp.]